MIRIFRGLHLLGLAAFLGAVLSHVVIAAVVPSLPAADRVGALMAKHLLSEGLLLPGLGLMLLSGMGLWATRGRQWPWWLKVKLGLVALMTLNGLVVLIPTGAAIAAAAAQGPVPDALAQRESLAGALNLVMIATVLVLSVGRFGPRRREVTA